MAWQKRQLVQTNLLPLGPEKRQRLDGADLASCNELGDLNSGFGLTQPQRQAGPIGLPLQAEIGPSNPRRQGQPEAP